MKPKTLIAGMILGVAAAAAPAQETQTTTEVSTQASQSQTTTTTITGTVVQYEPSKTIVIRHPDNRVVTYVLSSSLTPPTDLTIGRKVSIVTEPSDSGPVVVTRIETTSLTPEGNLKTTTEQREVSASDEETKTEVTAVYGTVSAFEPGKSITIVQPDKTTVTYVVNAESEIPSGLTTGRTVTVETTTVTGASSPVVRKVTYKKTTKTTVKP
jgi:hypothetical protein